MADAAEKVVKAVAKRIHRTELTFVLMSILVNPRYSRSLVQGITGSFGARHAQLP